MLSLGHDLLPPLRDRCRGVAVRGGSSLLRAKRGLPRPVKARNPLGAPRQATR